MTKLQIFNQYFKTKFIVWLTFAIIATIIRFFVKHDVTLLMFLIAVLISVVIALIIGLTDYNQQEKKLPKTISYLLTQPPLSDFISQGFQKEDDNKIVGRVNDFEIITSPFINNLQQKYLTVIIPILDDYVNKGFDENFKLKLSNEIFLAEAILKNYDKVFDSIQLNNLLENTIKNLKDKQIKPIEVADD